MSAHKTLVVARYYPDGHIEEGPERMTLEELQKTVGGYIELVSCILASRSLIVNEEGIGLDLPTNPVASRLVSPDILLADGGLRGVVLLVVG